MIASNGIKKIIIIFKACVSKKNKTKADCLH